jgi:hypothetical protein
MKIKFSFQNIDTTLLFSQLKERSIPYAIANAMSEASDVAMLKLKEDKTITLPQDKGPITDWTRNSIFKRPRYKVSPKKLQVTFGYKDRIAEKRGTPAGEYLNPNAASGTRPRKPWEAKVLSAMSFNGQQFRYAIAEQAPEIPGHTFDRHGNLPPSTYIKFKKLYDDGQQRIKVPVYYYFVANTIFAKARIGDKYSKEGIIVFALFKTPPNYRLTYGVDQIAYDLFNKQMPDALKNSVAKEVEIYLQRAKLGKR